MLIEIWSDIACPWCYIGKRRLEAALADFDHRDDVDIVYRSFQLDPTAPTVATETTQAMLAERYGVSRAEAAQMQARVTELAAAEGMTWRHDETVHANTLDAHRLLHLAKEVGRQTELKEALLDANFAGARNMADHDVLREIAVGAGLPAERVDAVLASEEFAADVRADVDQARAYGANGVPFFVVDQKYGVSGAQPTELFGQLLDRAWRESHPAVELVAGEADGACGPDGCAI
ncbi:DsbA family oxidoreductase [Nocardioides sp. CER19]|uniref:DsbA family oxidoreductase n=1 Tax=Nocardioides sp. CER19 TaxID=3038538 RepID=UPI00244A4304|nr:DsbA family oxidoreductase [Nocardioides sp. CER19]MDH2414119.1 DsbA family oxidoreductase [Nocardioides sp. CER19]